MIVPTREARMPVAYVCEYCGFAGVDPTEDDADRVQCRDCGELVVPLPPGSGLT
jgi:hypothetical protein